MQLFPSDSDTIAAIATPLGTGGIGIVKISGPRAFSIARSVFAPALETAFSAEPRRLILGYIRDPRDGRLIDEALVVFMPAPNTYTRQDVVEIQAHGSPSALTAILELVCGQGARPAGPGEFTRRAFLGGRMDLTQAEAVMELVLARTSVGARMAMSHLHGALNRAVNAMAASLLSIKAPLEASLDFPDEVEEPDKKALAMVLESEVLKPSQNLINMAGEGQILREGLRVAIVGRPNTGKSSLMNALLAHERAIVSPAPGTTRDLIEEPAQINGHYMLLVDTAGFHESLDPIEREGIKRAKTAIEQAHAVILVVDASLPLGLDDHALFDTLKNKTVIIAANKCDLIPTETRFSPPLNWISAPCVSISALHCTGLEALGQAIIKAVRGDFFLNEPAESAPNLRQKAALEKVVHSTADAIRLAQEAGPSELICLDLDQAISALGEVTGQSLPGDVLDSIFSRFCIGK